MNPLQTGTSASQLVPQQNFRNSSQSGVVQRSTNSSLQQSSSSSLLSAQPTKLRVVGASPQQQSVLGVNEQTPQSSATQGWVVGGFLLICAALAVYFFQRAINYAPQEENSDSDQSKTSKA
jgi:hypothetical protein